ncbi:MAG TPA: TonB-dependent receptor [Vicinamibacterales bacterium]|nr:TonB-dependent receptor [Vicinamibacterales bacterium]
MKVRVTAIAAVLALLLGVAPALAQVQTGEITGKVTDDTGAVLPGVTVTLTSPALIQPQTAVTSETGSFRFPLIPIGTYSVKFDLPGFKTVVREGIAVTIGFTANVNQQLAISTVQETVTVSGESPIVDTKATTAKTTFDLESLQSIPSARDPWVMLQRVPNISMDRMNVGGSQSGQQSGYISRGGNTGNNKWSLDGVDITDMSATGASPIYYDFDMMQEMQVTTGGADASQQTGGVGINFVTRSGTNRFKGSGRIYNTNDRFEADNVTDEIRAQGAGSGAPIQNINDVGFEVGGPIMRDKLWYWGSYGKQDIKVGVVNFYENTPTCRPAGVPVSQIANVLGSTEAIRDCLATDLTTLDNYNWKVTWAPVKNNKFNFQNTWGGKVRSARDASDTRPLETAYRQKNIDSTFGTWGWDAGPVPIWKASDQHVLTDRLLVDVQYAHIGNNFTLTFQDPAQRDLQPRFDIASGVWARSYNESVFMRPTQSVDLTTSYFLPATLGGDHAFKAGYRWRTALGRSISHTGGNAVARYTDISSADEARRTCSTFAGGCNADLFRDGFTEYDLDTHAFYVQDTFTVRRLTLNLGVRWDRQSDAALPADVPANPIIPQIMPAISFPGVSAGVVWNDISPRLGMTYDLFGTGKSVARASYSMYYGQMGPGQLAGELISISQVSVRYPWADLNGDTLVQANELNTTTFLTKSASFDPNNPTSYLSPGRIDPDLKNDRTREFVVGLQQEVMRNLAVEVNYVWRKYDQFTWTDRDNWSPANFQAFTLNPTNCGPTAVCQAVTYYRATSPQPSPYIRTNQPDRWRDYNGIEVAMTKRYSDRWAASVSLAWNDAVDKWGSLAGVEDPTNLENLNGASFAPESGGSGVDNVFNNAEWLFKASGQYTTPLWDISVAGNTSVTQGYPFPQQIAVTSRGNQLADTNVYLFPLGDVRLPNVFVADFRVDKAFNFGGLRIIPSLDIFNVTNSSEILSRRRTQYSYNVGTGVGSSSTTLPPNNISSIIAPRVIRFGARVTW